jgi:transcriptional regulator with AAA-type ATPase domain
MNTPDIRDDEIIGASLNNLKSIIETFALQGEKLLFLGGRGTGKELLAKLYKKYSKREKFIPINCAGISDSLLLSELFGHKKGAFTGADSDREGILSKWGEQAVIFLDEIGDASERFQAALLRVLETGDYTRVGEDDPRNIDLNKTRLVAATTKHRGIRSELLDRFICLTIPALSERQSDIPLFLKHFMKNSNIEYISKAGYARNPDSDNPDSK